MKVDKLEIVVNENVVLEEYNFGELDFYKDDLYKGDGIYELKIGSRGEFEGLDLNDEYKSMNDVEDIARWYIIHAYSGHEERVKKNLEQRIETLDIKHKILNVVVPTEEEVEIKSGVRKTISKKVFPGYILVQMNMDDESWHMVRNTPGVTGFISSEDEQEKRSRPIPLEDSEVEEIIKQIESGWVAEDAEDGVEWWKTYIIFYKY